MALDARANRDKAARARAGHTALTRYHRPLPWQPEVCASLIPASTVPSAEQLRRREGIELMRRALEERT